MIADIPAAEPEVIEAALIQPAIQPAPPLPEAVPTETLPPPVAPEAASATPAGNPIWRVTARRVNLRAGPSTADAVVGQAVENDSAEVIELLPSGWAKVYILEQGTEAFMSAQFLAAPE